MSAYSDPEYQRNRKRLLADQPPCAWCGKPATTADHLIELDRGGSNNADNLVAACSACNSKRGSLYQAKKIAQRQHTRREALRDNGIPIGNENTKPIFLHKQTLTPTPMLSVSFEGNQPELAVIGHDQPRLETPVADAAGSFAGELGGWVKRVLNIDLMPWQLHTLGNQLAFDGNLDLLHRTTLTSTARQNGKTVALMSLVGFWLCEMPKIRGEKQLVLSTAHRLDLAVMLFDELAPILEAQFDAKLMRAYGRNMATMPDGSRWIVRAAAPSAGHGVSPNLIVADEIWDISSDVIDGGLIPSQRAKRNPLLSMWSTAGTERSRALLKWREQGMRAIDTNSPTPFYFAEWSPPPDLDPMTPAAWGWGNPALTHTLTPATIVAESQNPDRAQFLRASVNVWVASDQGWLQPGTWPALEHHEPLPAGGVVAIENSVDESRYFGLRAVALADGRTCVTVAFVCNTYAEMLEAAKPYVAHPTTTFAITPSIDLHWPVEYERRKQVVGYGEMVKWTDPVRQLIRQGMVLHTGETMLAEHVQRAVAVRSQNSVALSSQRSPGPIELARCAVWAIALASKPKSAGKPFFVVAS